MDIPSLESNRVRAHRFMGMLRSSRPGVVLVEMYILLAQYCMYIRARRSQDFDMN